LTTSFTSLSAAIFVGAVPQRIVGRGGQSRLGQRGGNRVGEVVDHRLAQRLLVERGGGMKHRHDDAPADLLRLAVNRADLRAWEELRHREAPQRHDHLGVDRGDLAIEVVGAGGHLLWQRVAVIRRAVLDDVGDEDRLAIQSNCRQQLVEELSRRANERTSLLVLAIARRLADEHYLGVGAALARHRILRANVQVTLHAIACLGGDLRQRLLRCLGHHVSS
jgi:hypothetical protein